MTSLNNYYSAAAVKTYSPLYVYYKPTDYYNKAGYYSTTFSLVYYDGYGYNFYYGDYGYYEYSLNEEKDWRNGWYWQLVFPGFLGITFFCRAYFTRRGGCCEEEEDMDVNEVADYYKNKFADMEIVEAERPANS